MRFASPVEQLRKTKPKHVKELFAAFLASVAKIKDQANAALAGLPPLEQHEASSEISYGIRSLQRYGAELATQAESLNGMVEKFHAEAPTRNRFL